MAALTACTPRSPQLECENILKNNRCHFKHLDTVEYMNKITVFAKNCLGCGLNNGPKREKTFCSGCISGLPTENLSAVLKALKTYEKALNTSPIAKQSSTPTLGSPRTPVLSRSTSESNISPNSQIQRLETEKQQLQYLLNKALFAERRARQDASYWRRMHENKENARPFVSQFETRLARSASPGKCPPHPSKHKRHFTDS